MRSNIRSARLVGRSRWRARRVSCFCCPGLRLPGQGARAPTRGRHAASRQAAQESAPEDAAPPRTIPQSAQNATALAKTDGATWASRRAATGAARDSLSTPRAARPASPATIPAAMTQAGGAGGHLRISNLRRELCLACHRQETEAGPRVEIVSPLERAVVQEERLALIGRASRLSGCGPHRAPQRLRVPPPGEGGEFSTWLKLQDGVNRIEIAQEERAPLGGRGLPRREFPGQLRARLLGAPHREPGAMRRMPPEDGRAALRGRRRRAAALLRLPRPERREALRPRSPGGRGLPRLPRPPRRLRRRPPAAGAGAAVRELPRRPRERRRRWPATRSGKGCVDCHDPHQSDTRYLLKGPQYTMRERAAGQSGNGPLPTAGLSAPRFRRMASALECPGVFHSRG